MKKYTPYKLFFTIMSLSVCSFAAQASTSILKIKIASASYSDEIAVRFMQGTTPGFDGCCDAWKLFAGNNAVPQLYTKTDIGDELAINSLPSLGNIDNVALFVRTGFATTYSFTVTKLDSFPASATIELIDNVTGTVYDLKSTATYIISLPAIALSSAARFVVKVTYSPTAVLHSDPDNQAINIFPSASAGTFYITGLIHNGEAKVYSMTGQAVYSKHLEVLSGNEPERVELPNVPDGVYFLKVLTGGRETTKIIMLNH